MFPSEFSGEVRHGKTRVMGLPCGVSFMILASTVFLQSTRVTDIRPDVRTELRSHTRYSIYAVARKNASDRNNSNASNHRYITNLQANYCSTLSRKCLRQVQKHCDTHWVEKQMVVKPFRELLPAVMESHGEIQLWASDKAGCWQSCTFPPLLKRLCIAYCSECPHKRSANHETSLYSCKELARI